MAIIFYQGGALDVVGAIGDRPFHDMSPNIFKLTWNLKNLPSIIFNNLFEFFLGNYPSADLQRVFCEGKSCVVGAIADSPYNVKRIVTLTKLQGQY